MADGVAKLLRATPRDLAVRVARGLDACTPRALPPKPPDVRHIDNDQGVEWMRSGPPGDQRELYERWLAWWIERGSAIHDNEARLRGALWCYAELRRAFEADKNDREALELGRLVRELLREVWRIPDPPLALKDRNELARKVVEGLLR